MNNRHFEDQGDAYALYRPTYPLELAKSLSEHVGDRKLALDVGCGTGQFSVLLAAFFDSVRATDVSEDQLTNAIPHPQVSYNIGSAEQFQLEDQSVDMITAAQAAHWFDLPKFYSEARRVLKPDGLVALITYGVFDILGPARDRARDRILEFYWHDIHSFWPDRRKHVETGYSAFEFPFREIELPALTIERNWTAEQLLNYCATWSAVKRAKAAGRDDLLENFRTDLIKIMGPTQEMTVSWPIKIRAGTVHA